MKAEVVFQTREKNPDREKGNGNKVEQSICRILRSSSFPSFLQ